MKVKWNRQATNDLDSIAAYISHESLDHAVTLVESFHAHVRTLRDHPHRGRKGTSRQIRELVVAPYIIGYTVRKDHVEILGVVHSAQQFYWWSRWQE